MSAHGPRWLALAEAVYALLLRLYPRELREAHGEEMRQAFRDRCREVATGRIRAWRLLSLELAPDLVISVAHARMAESRGSASPRALAGVLLLGSLALVLIFQESLSPRINDSAFGISARWQHWRAERALLRDEAQVRRVAVALSESASVEDRALAAYLYRANERGRDYEATYAIGSKPMTFEPLPADGEGASRLLATVPMDPGLEAARLAARACIADAACDRFARVQALLRSEPDNAYGWSLLLKLHSLAGDEAAVAADLRRIASSSRYDDGMAAVHAAAFSAVSRLAPGDAQAMAAVARRMRAAAAMDNLDFRHGLRFHCSIAVNGSSAWLRAHPESLPDCRSAAMLLSNSKAPRDSDWGWRWRVRDDASPENRAGLDAAFTRISREVWELGATPLEGNSWRPWTDAEWQAWALAKLDESGR